MFTYLYLVHVSVLMIELTMQLAAANKRVAFGHKKKLNPPVQCLFLPVFL